MYWFKNSVKINRVFLEYLGQDDYVVIYVFSYVSPNFRWVKT